MSDDRFKISWSSLQRWQECKQKDYLIRQRMASPVKDVRNFLAGTVVDRIMRDWLEEPNKQDMSAMLEEYFEKTIIESEQGGVIKWRDKNDRAKIKKVCAGALTELQPILEARVLPYDYDPAMRFYTPVKIRKPDGELQEIVLRGEFDLLVRDPKDGRYIVWDLKTTANNDYWKKSLGQLVFYDLAIISMFGQAPKKAGFIQPICDEQVKEFAFTSEDRANMWGNITAMMMAEWNDDHSPKADNTGCSFCEVNHACAKFNRPMILKRNL